MKLYQLFLPALWAFIALQTTPLGAQEEVTVSVLPSPAFLFSKYCFDASEQTGRPLEPADNPSWIVLTAAEKSKLNLADGVRAYALQDVCEGALLILTVTDIISSKPTEPSLTQCSIIYTGDYDTLAIERELRRKFKRSGSDAAIGRSGGVPRREGWKQLTWAGVIKKDSSDWQLEYGWLTTNPRFYTASDLVNVQFRYPRNNNLTIIEMNHYYRRSED